MYRSNHAVSDADVEASAHRLRSVLNWTADKPVMLPESLAAKVALAPEVLGADHEGFLKAVVSNPYRPSSKIAPDLGISHRKAISLRKDLCREGRLKEWAIDSQRGGQKVVLLVPLQESGCERSDNNPGRGGALHKFAIGCTEASLTTDRWTCQREAPFTVGAETTFVDLVAERSCGEKLFVEFELRPDYAKTNVRKDLAVGTQRIMIVTATRKCRNAIKKGLLQTLSPAEFSRVGFSLLSSFIDSH